MTTLCPICEAITHPFDAQQGYSFNRCDTCGLFFVDPMPTLAHLAKVYSPDVGYQSNKIKINYKNLTNDKYITIFEKLKKYTIPALRVLDVGASDGEFLYYARKDGLEPFGVEPNKTTADIANSNNLNVFCGFLEECGFSKNSFGLLRLGDVLEHSSDPNTLVRQSYEFLAPNGLLLVSIPNMDSFWAKSTYLFKKFLALPWSILEAPHHLLYFSESNLDTLMNKHGFQKTEVWYNRPPTLKYELGSTHLFGKFKREKSLRNAFMFVFGFLAYSLLYIIDYLLTPFKKKDYSMVCIYKKDA